MTLMPGVWSEPVPWDKALWLKARGMVEIDGASIALNDQVWIDADGAYNLFWMSPFSVGDGYATAAENVVHCLMGHGVKLSIRYLWFLVKEGLLPETMKLLDQPVEVPHLVGLCMATPGEFSKLPTPYKIGLTMYEASDPLSIRPEWLHQCNDPDALFVPTQYSKEVFSQFVHKPIYITPLAIDPIFCTPQGEVPAPRVPNDKFRVTCHGTLTGRKSPVEALDVFQKAFPIAKYPDVEMVFKTRSGFFGYDFSQIPPVDDPRVTILDAGRWTRQQMREYLDSSDCSLILSKGEGFGMPARETIAMGVPTILANNTGHVEVCDDRYNWPIPDSHIEETPLGGTWCIPDWDYAVDALRSVYNNREAANLKAAQGAAWFSKTWGDERVAQGFKEAFQALADPRATVDHRQISRQARKLASNGLDAATVTELARIHTPYVSAACRLGSGRKTVLDLGVGNGITAQMFARRNLRVVGIDKDPVAFESCIQLFNGLHPTPVLRELDVFELSSTFLRGCQIDRSSLMCTSQGMLEHYEDGDIRRIIMTVLRHSDWFIFSVPSVYYPSRDNGDERLMRKEQWLGILEKFNVVSGEYYSDNRHLCFAIHGADPPVRGTLVRYGRKADSVWRPS